MGDQSPSDTPCHISIRNLSAEQRGQIIAHLNRLTQLGCGLGLAGRLINRELHLTLTRTQYERIFEKMRRDAERGRS